MDNVGRTYILINWLGLKGLILLVISWIGGRFEKGKKLKNATNTVPKWEGATPQIANHRQPKLIMQNLQNVGH